jgi:hypothetical protein
MGTTFLFLELFQLAGWSFWLGDRTAGSDDSRAATAAIGPRKSRARENGGMGVNFEYLFLGLFVAIAGYFVFNLIRHNGLKGALFGGRIVETFGEVPGTKLRELPDDADSVRRTEAQELLRLLQRAIDATA